MHRLPSLSSSLIRARSGLRHSAAAAAQAPAWSPSLPTSDVNYKSYSTLTGGSSTVNEPRTSPRVMHFNNPLSLGRRYGSTAVESDESEEPLSPLLRYPPHVSGEEYMEFYYKTFNDYVEPLDYCHHASLVWDFSGVSKDHDVRASELGHIIALLTESEFDVDYRYILYVPAVAPTGNKNIRLYNKGVFVSDDFEGELLPGYLSFVNGVVDSSLLLVNDSGELLQECQIVQKLRERWVEETFKMIEAISMREGDDCKKFWDNYGKHMKLGCVEDPENRPKLAPLLRFFSSESGEDMNMISLDEYVDNMKQGQEGIYYIAADSVTSAKKAPSLAKFLDNGLQVLFMVDPIDEVVIQSLKSYKEKKFIDVNEVDSLPQFSSSFELPTSADGTTCDESISDRVERRMKRESDSARFLPKGNWSAQCRAPRRGSSKHGEVN